MTGVPRALAATACRDLEHVSLGSIHLGFPARSDCGSGIGMGHTSQRNWLLLVSARHQDPVTQLEALALQDSFSLQLWSALPDLHQYCSLSRNTFSAVDVTCLTTGSDNVAPAMEITRHFALESPSAGEVRIRDLHGHVLACQSHCVPYRSLASRSTLVTPRPKFLLHTVRTPSLLNLCRTRPSFTSTQCNCALTFPSLGAVGKSSGSISP